MHWGILSRDSSLAIAEKDLNSERGSTEPSSEYLKYVSRLTVSTTLRFSPSYVIEAWVFERRPYTAVSRVYIQDVRAAARTRYLGFTRSIT